MVKPRKRHVQTEIVFKKWGGRRRGSGPKRRGPRSSVPHLRREDFSDKHPLHVTLRVLDEVGRLRRREAFHAVRKAMLVVTPREDFRIVHLSIQGNHIHVICEASSREALTSGMTAFKTSVGRRINRAFGRCGRVFADRYHVEVLSSPAQVRNALAYVMNNWRKHGEDRGACYRVDPFSTGIFFRGWKETDIPKVLVIPSGADVLPYREPRTWLLAEGWKRARRPISLYEVPGAR
jgi:REP element-mobilizing transposase RayT